MIHIIAIAALLCVAITFGLALAHALELPGKMRLDRNEYVAVQAIYYPGFTYGGLIGELGEIVLLAAVRFKYRYLARWWYPWFYFLFTYVAKLGFLDRGAGFHYAFYKVWYFRTIRLLIREQAVSHNA